MIIATTPVRVAAACAVALTLLGCSDEALVEPPFTGATIWSTRAQREGTQLVLEQVVGKDRVRVALEERWGGSIVEISLNDLNFVNAHDPGREIQLSLYDGNHRYDDCAGCRGVWGWNPVQAGDIHTAGSRILERQVSSEGLYVKLRPLEWFPDNKGGASGWPVASDIEVEQWITFLDLPGVIRLTYRIRHLGSDHHGDTFLQEFPAMYVNHEFSRFATYSGSEPWTLGQVTAPALTRLFVDPPLRIPTTEWWGAFIDARGIGLTIFTPGSYPLMTSGVQAGTGGPRGSGTAYTHPYNPFGLAPQQVIEGDVYLLVGDYRESRKVIYRLKDSIQVRDIAAPIMDFERPADGSTVTGVVELSGWAFDNREFRSLEIRTGDAALLPVDKLEPRPDISRRWPWQPAVNGFSKQLDTRILPNGRHRLTLVATDAAGNEAHRTITVKVAN